MKGNRLGSLVVVGAAVFAAGCARLGLNPMPTGTETGGMQHGLDPFPEPSGKAGTGEMGLDPFPRPVHAGESNDTGLTPFPDEAKKVDEDGEFGLNPFPKKSAKKAGPEYTKVGLDPFPNASRKGSKPAPAAKGTSRTVQDDVPESEEYPGAPPVVAPPAPERSGSSGDAQTKKKKKRPAWKDE